MISMDRPTSGHDLIFFPYFSSILFFCFLFLVVFFSLYFFFLEIPKLHNHRDLHEERIESNRTRGKGNKGKREQGNKQTSIYCMRWVLFVGVVFSSSPHARDVWCVLLMMMMMMTTRLVDRVT